MVHQVKPTSARCPINSLYTLAFYIKWGLLLLLLLLRRAPRALESGPSERQHLLGVGREDSEWERRTTKGVLPEAIEVGAISAASVRVFAVPPCAAGT